MGVMDLRRAIIANQDNFIPPEYKRYDWIATKRHDARIDTGVSGDDETLQIHCEFMPVTLNENYVGLFGNYQTESDTKCWRIITNTASNSVYNRSLLITCGDLAASGTNGGTYTLLPVNENETILNKKMVVDMTYGKCTIIGTKTDAKTSTNVTSIPSSSYTIAIGSSRPVAAGTGTTSFRIYKFVFRSHGKMIRNYFPVVRLSDNKAGLYDTVNGTFNPSIGSAEFLAGND